VTLTPILRLNVPEFDQDPWDTDVNDNWYVLDATVGRFITVPNLTGIWKNSTDYAVGQTAIEQSTSITWQCMVAHTSPAEPTTFSDDRAANPGRWNEITASAQFYAQQAAASAVDAAHSASEAANSASIATGGMVPLAGGTMTGPLLLSADPLVPTGAATKHYVDTHGGTSGSSNYIDIKRDYNAVGDGVADDTAAINAMIAGVPANAMVFWPAGTYKTTASITVSKQMTWVGAGRTATTVKGSQAVASTFVFGAPIYISNMGFGCSVTATSGAMLRFDTAASRSRLENFWMDTFYNGIFVNGASDVMFIDGQMFNWVANGTAIIYTGGEAAVIDNLIIEQGTRPGTGVGLQVNNGGIQLINTEIMACGTCLLLNPGSGQSVVSMWVVNTGFDNASKGIDIRPTGTGVVQRCWFADCWMSSMDNDGVSIVSPAASSVDGIDFNNCHVFDNKGHGFNIQDVNARNLSFDCCKIAGNTGTGIQFFAGGQNFRIANCIVGPYGGFGYNHAAGVNIGGSSSLYHIINNHLLNSGTNPLIGSGLQAGSYPGTNEIISNNLGYASQNRGTINISPGATSFVVNHGLPGTPRLMDITLTEASGLGNPPSVTVWAASPTASSFTIWIGVAVAFTVTVNWKAVLPCTP